MAPEHRLVAITGAHGFIGRNLAVRLGEAGFTVRPIGRDTDPGDAAEILGAADIVFHLAGANRPADPADFMATNRDYALAVADAIAAGGRTPLVICSSTAKAGEDNEYGRSKQAGERAMLDLGESDGATVIVYRLPNIFGKWARPDYNSAVATFCHNIARGLPITVNNPAAALSLLYIDDLIDTWLALLAAPPAASGFAEAGPVHATTVGEVAESIRAIERDRHAGLVAEVGRGLTRALYATFIAALPETAFSYPITAHVDPRGSFSEMIKTPASGQISYFTAHPGVTRGGHYHHSKVEKFLIVQGEARFRFRHILTGAEHEVHSSGKMPMVVETIPGWAHDVTNVGDDMMISLLWANEIFDRARPDTIALPL